MINELGFAAYFLINWDVVRYTAAQYFYVGRGSGANSIVAYCLRITDVDRLISVFTLNALLILFAPTLPDFDLDFS